MSNRTYICIDCHTARRAEAAYWLSTALRCANCRGPLWELSRKWRIPKKDDRKGWEELKEIIRQEEPARQEFLKARGKDLLAKIEKRIESAGNHRSAETIHRLQGQLRKRKETVMRQYFPESEDQTPGSS